MKKLFVFILIIAAFLPANLLGQVFAPEGYTKPLSEPARLFKSHILTDQEVLLKPSAVVNLPDTSLRQLISLMYKTVTDSASLGVGIAAPQIGINKRVILVQRLDKQDNPFEAYINPQIIKYSDLTDLRIEGCLSVDTIRAEVERSYAILLNYFTVEGEFKIEMVEGFTARIFQHEIDHLNGILFTERAAVKY